MKLAHHTTIGLGGPAREFVLAEDDEQVLSAVRRAGQDGVELLVLGGGSNLVVSDDGVDAVVLSLGDRSIQADEEAGRTLVRVGAGASFDEWVAFCVERGWSGVECLSGIPGQVGSTPIQNVGAYGQEVADTITRVRVLDRASGAIEWLSAEECAFGYRTSRFKAASADRLLVLTVEFSLGRAVPASAPYPELERALAANDEPRTLARIRRTVLELRQRKSMLLDPNDENGRSCGSFFTNPLVDAALVEQISTRAGERPPAFPQPDGRVKLAAAWLIERAGLGRGTRSGSVGLSTRHTLALVAHPGATARELVAFAWSVRERVETAFGVRLVPEPVFWGFSRLEDGLPVL